MTYAFIGAKQLRCKGILLYFLWNSNDAVAKQTYVSY